MNWQTWIDELRHDPQQAVTDLLRGAAPIHPFERVAPYEFLLAVLPRNCRRVTRSLLGEPLSTALATDLSADLSNLLDQGLTAWLLSQCQAPLPAARKLSAYAAQVCEALQWPLYFDLPQSLAALQAERARWLPWVGSLTLTAYRDPEFDYWQVLAVQQPDDGLQFFWQLFVLEAGRTRSLRYLNLGLLALAQLPLSEDDSLRNLRLQVQALITRCQRRKASGTLAQQELANGLRSVMARNLSMGTANYRAFLQELLAPLGEDKTTSVLTLVGLAQPLRGVEVRPGMVYKLKPPGQTEETDQAVQAVYRSGSLAQAWSAIRGLLTAHENYLHKTGDAYYFVRNLDRCARALCDKYSLRDPEIQQRLFQWIYLALRLDADNPRLWMLWELALRQADQPQRAQWVLWEMIRRFPSDVHSRLELARLLIQSGTTGDQTQARYLLQQVLQLDPDDVHAHFTLAQLAIRDQNWDKALTHATKGRHIKPSDGHSAWLLATIYVKRNGAGDLQSAIDELKNFVKNHPGNTKSEGYLRDLLQRQQRGTQGVLHQLFEYESDDQSVEPPHPETDAAWLSFAESVRTCVAPTTAPMTFASAEGLGRVLPLPQALQQAIEQQQWDAEVLAPFDNTALLEFPLETSLWRYLLALQTGASTHDREIARQAVQAGLEIEKTNTPNDDRFWLPYLNQHSTALLQATPDAVAVGATWLQDLLSRYRPLPAPVMA